ncbi:YcaO-like domain protein [Candidatus Magnetomorum sp. HK-1]|nr:YcaO-like domain protein [Candidatus Magnetomorum sp. HK-1]
MSITFLNDAYKRSCLDQDKVITPEETIDRAKKKLQQIDLDILQEIRRIDNNRLGIPVYFSLYGSDAQKSTGKRKQMGKGADPAQAEASAIMEMVERYSLYDFMQQDSHFQTAEYRNLKNNVISFDKIARSVHDDVGIDSREYQFFSELPLRWTQAYDIRNESCPLIPFDWFFQINAYNGSSAGNCMEEAIIQGMSEIIERHVCDIIHREKPPVNRIDINTVDDPIAVDLIRRYHQAGIQLYIFDYSLDTGIPVLGGIAYDPSTFPESSEIVWTSGAMPDPNKSFCRLLTEIAQLSGDFNSNSNYEPSGLPKLTKTGQIDEYHPSMAIIPFSQLNNISNNNIKTEILNYQNALQSVLPDTYIVDLTHSKIDLPACYTITPGARFRERSANANMGLFTAKLMTSVCPHDIAIKKLDAFDHALPGKYYIPFYKGTLFLSSGAYDEALNCFSSALNREPPGEDLCGTYLYIGICEKNAGHYRRAVNALRYADKIDNFRTDVLNLLGACYYQLQQYENAIDCFERVIKIDPGSAMDHANLGVNYKAIGNHQKAMVSLEKAVSLDPGISFAWEHLLSL